VVAILGARQVGKTTLARQLMAEVDGPTTRFDLEDPDDLARLQEPKLALAGLRGLVVIDEVQRRPGLFQILRVLVDRPEADVTFLVLGSASPELLRQSSETLAGRIAYHELTGLRLDEVSADAAPALWLRGGFPPATLATDDAASFRWLRDFVRTFVERDLPQLGVRTPAPTIHRFWTMLSHHHAQIFNGAELARAFGVSAATVRRYLDQLSGSLVLRQLQPWFENVAKRQVRAPKIYIEDTGVLHSLLGIESREALDRHPKVGASWEGFVLGELTTRLGAQPRECFFWGTHAGAELDLLWVRGIRRLGFEIKRTTAPRTTRSMRSALETLRLDHLYVVHAGAHTFSLDPAITALAFDDASQEIA
jgi:hypothetical protein